MKNTFACVVLKPLKTSFSVISGSNLTMTSPKQSTTLSQKYYYERIKYFKEEAQKYPANHPQRSYVKRTAETTGLPYRTIQWVCQSQKSSSADMPDTATTTAHPESSAAVPISVPVKASETATPKMNSRSVIVDDFDKCVLRRKIQVSQSGSIKLLAVLRNDICCKGSEDSTGSGVPEGDVSARSKC